MFRNPFAPKGRHHDTGPIPVKRAVTDQELREGVISDLTDAEIDGFIDAVTPDDGQPVTADPPIKNMDWSKARAARSTSGHEPVTAAVAELALRVYHEHRDDPRYTGIYKLAYEGALSYADADIEILALTVMDEAAKNR